MQQLLSHHTQAIDLKAILSTPAQFKAAGITDGNCSLASFNRRDFYKISLVLSGSSRLTYADKEIEISKPALVFTSPTIAYSWEALDDDKSGYFCVFTPKFLEINSPVENLQESRLYKAGGSPVYFLDKAQVKHLTGMFLSIIKEADNEYIYKFELICNYVNLILHEAMKMQPAVADAHAPNAAYRITKTFFNLLESQFPVDSPAVPVKYKKAGDYADALSVHVNHLNAAVHDITGKSTTAHLNERIIVEAKSLLLHTNWNISEIAFSLGFEYPTYFNNFFKKNTGTFPKAIRQSL